VRIFFFLTDCQIKSLSCQAASNVEGKGTGLVNAQKLINRKHPKSVTNVEKLDIFQRNVNLIQTVVILTPVHATVVEEVDIYLKIVEVRTKILLVVVIVAVKVDILLEIVQMKLKFATVARKVVTAEKIVLKVIPQMMKSPPLLEIHAMNVKKLVT